MGADLSRIRSNPLLDFAGVELKQGGVVLDGDVNELVAVIDRRLRAVASDVLGRSTVSQTTPDAFEIKAVMSALSIGKGRLYVDGLLAENHGAPSADPAKNLFDPLMAEPMFADPVDYAKQTYLPSVPRSFVQEARRISSTSTSGSAKSRTWSPDGRGRGRRGDQLGVADCVAVRVLADDAGSATCSCPTAMWPAGRPDAPLVGAPYHRRSTCRPRPIRASCSLPGYRGWRTRPTAWRYRIPAPGGRDVQVVARQRELG
jgi:hypothetical protein